MDQRQDFYDWCATQYGYSYVECPYCGVLEDWTQCADPWGHADREAARIVYEALLEGVNTWGDLDIEQIPHFYGTNYPEPDFGEADDHVRRETGTAFDARRNLDANRTPPGTQTPTPDRRQAEPEQLGLDSGATR